jgi:hypothetical protein
MESIVKADIFFFISSGAVIVLSLLSIVLFWYLIKAGKNLYMLSRVLKSSFKDSEEFVAELRERLEGNIAFRLFFPRLRKKRRVTAKNISDADEK